MKRIQKKCFLGSLGAHAFLVVILLVAPAFFKKPRPKKDTQPVNLIDHAVLAAIANAGAAAAPSLPQPKPVPPKAETPKPKPQVKKAEPKPKPKPPKPKPKPKPVQKKKAPTPKPKPKPIIKQSKAKPKTRPMVTKSRPKTTPKPKRIVPKIKVGNLNNLVSQRDEKAERERQRKAADAARRAQERERRLRKNAVARAFDGTSKYSKNPVRISVSGGGSGRATMDYGRYLVNEYDRLWSPPRELSGRAYLVTIRVTVSKSGRVTSKRITKRSGVSSVDSSVQRTLDRATKFRPFPAGMNESQKTFTIVFDLKAK